jgi:uncharacterized OsmC-like protein
MNAETLRARQAPIKEKYKTDPAAALVTHVARGRLGTDDVTCEIENRRAPVIAGLHAAAGGDGTAACAGDLLLEALVACAGTTMKAVSTALGIPIKSGTVIAEGEVDFRGTLGVSKEVPVGFAAIRLRFLLATDADEAALAKLVALTERYCVVLQTLRAAPGITTSLERV